MSRDHRREKMWERYKLTPEQFDKKLKDQGKKCACCGAKTPGSKKGWHVDHCHNSKKVRGILCARCNVAIGIAEENITRLRAIIIYLRKHKAA